ncbi:DivIVA domain-containing protein [Devriesea agamarum]|uniref:DivIVA domain-containing protein n=1 Tax=Devriesea agamarum TaxID=472569 RepID=UPI00071E2C47|nr:DivIVA domain-containing protein [Devriesea agamarum]
MSTAFELVSRFRIGYDVAEVDAFLSRARAAYEGVDGTDDFDPASIITTTFATQRGGYDMSIVDEALDRLADAFALKQRDQAIAVGGEEAWVRELTLRAEKLTERLRRPAGQRFAPAREGRRAYDRTDVDTLCDQLAEYFGAGLAMSVDDVRRAAFRRRKGPDGYDEAVVDVYLDHVADVMASVP